MSDPMDIDDEPDLWTSPVKNVPPESRPKTPNKTPRTPRTPKTPTANDHQSEPLDREAMLRKELQGVRSINQVIEGVIGTLQRAGGNMNASLDLYDDPFGFSPRRYIILTYDV
ncbi:hypothetical protein A9Z42_0092790 [Trichoderma parareesei]|uniref:Uncharacterized protein n=1 Tax=Trichoderma parareesei TaxID=858221 RepID=A0A2H3A921_TRIPA|nr:hypothetical protein A9Z42_0092790 [Trichoderma parareesei]